MATKRKSPVPAYSNGGRNNSLPTVPWQGFINVHLSDAVKKKAAEYWQQQDFLAVTVARSLEQGYRITLKYEPNSQSFSAFMTHTDPQHKDAGWGLSERAGDWVKALQRIMYIHHVVLDGDWDNAKQLALPGLDDW